MLIATETTLPNGIQIIFREEEEKDYREVELLTRQAFWNNERAAEHDGAGCDEHYLCHSLRKAPGFVPELDFVALHGGKIVGNIMYCNASVQRPDGSLLSVLIFGPLSVLPEYQRMGVGSMILCHSVKAAKKLGFGSIFLYGHPDYYPRFGFVDAEKFSVTTEDGKNFPAFMCMELIPGYIGSDGGAFLLPPVYDIDAGEADSYDKLFR